MRIDEFLNQSVSTKRLNSYKRLPGQAATFSLNEEKQDKVSISSEAKEAQQQGGYFSQSNRQSSQARTEFKAYMDKATGREPAMPKSTEEKIKELNEKLQKLKWKLSDVATDPSLPEAVKSSQSQNLTSQINAIQAELNQIAQDQSEGVL